MSRTSSSSTREDVVRPPAPPWRQLDERTDPLAYVSIYLSDALARYPVRAVTKPRDNKSDPNIETGTYGLFSTCQITMRRSIVTRGVPYILFVTTHRDHRVLTGYFRIRWYAPGPDRDFALAAAALRFVDPIRASSVSGALGEALRVRRGYKGLDVTLATRAIELVQSKPDYTNRYLDEIKRLEALSARFTGFRYPTWEREPGWSWSDAATYLAPSEDDPQQTVPNQSPSDIWLCAGCAKQSLNKARLKRCPKCGALGTLRPLTLEV